MADIDGHTVVTTTEKPTRRPRISRRTIGKTMIGIGIVGLLISIASIAIGRSLVSEVEHSVDASLVVTDEALSAVQDSIKLTGTIVQTIRSGVSSVQETIGIIDASLGQANTAISDTQTFLGGSLPDSLDAVAKVLPTIESVASTVDDTLRALSDIPFGPDYNPSQPFDETIGQLSDAIGPLPDQLRTLAGDFDQVTGSTADISTQIEALGEEVATLGTQLATVSTLVERYATTASDASDRATQSRADLASSAKATRLLILLLGIVFALGQIVPIWLGVELLNRSAGHTVVHPHR
jgi:ABC-type transporter Mla subunit MlaD